MERLLVQIVARRKLFILRSQYTTGGRRSVKYTLRQKAVQ
jgi:hypothetical protein